MRKNFGTIAFTEGVKREQEHWNSRRQYERMEQEGPDTSRFGPFEMEFIEARDSFYVASVGEDGWPYMQHRGGKPGFLRVIDDRTLAFADFRGNRQYITVGHVKHDPRVCLFLMDYPNQTRLKIYGRVEVKEGAEAKQYAVAGERAIVERAMVVHLEAYDWNCPQHITPRYTKEEWEAMTRLQQEKTGGESKG